MCYNIVESFQKTILEVTMLQFKDKIKKLRKEKDMTQEQLAEYMGVSPQAVSRWETGITCPDIFALPALAELFGITVDGLLGVDEKEKQKEIRSIISVAEEKINQGITDEPIVQLREALNKYPNKDHCIICDNQDLPEDLLENKNLYIYMLF